ncbi:hypothetical protein DL93DRAFT_2064615, partial [Clavulina sp. PMI_390]
MSIVEEHPAMDEARQWFSFDDGDVVLRSEDGVDFRVDSLILRRASGLFADIFALPPKQQNDCSSSSSPEPIAMIEPASVIDDLLRLIYPISASPTITSDAQALSLLRA